MVPDETSIGGGGRDFPQTQWGLVLRLQHATDDVRAAALDELCRSYWKPVYHFLRLAWSKSNDDAKDLTQAFFLWVAEKEVLKEYSPERASFRAYLKTLLRHFAANRNRAKRRLKRGGGVRILPLDELQEGGADDPHAAFEEAWLNEIVFRGVDRVRQRLAMEGRETWFRVFEEHDLAAADSPPPYQELAGRLGISASDVANYLFRVRKAIRSEIRAELARVTSTAEELEEEWRSLFG
jgi:RNA polymerase sigma factor (sigma-70 family)